MNLPLGGGQSAELRERLTYAQGRAVRAAFVAIELDRNAMVDLDLALVAAFVSSWHVLDLDGNSVALDQPELAPDDVIQSIGVAALKRWKGLQHVPKAGPARTLTTPREQPSSLKIAT